MPNSVTFPSINETYSTDDFTADGGYGYKDPTTGVVAMLDAAVRELNAAATVQSVSPGPAGNVLVSQDDGAGGTEWASGQGVSVWSLEMMI